MSPKVTAFIFDMWLSTDGKRLFAMSFAKNVVSEFDTQNFHLISDHPMGEKGDADHTYYQAMTRWSS